MFRRIIASPWPVLGLWLFLAIPYVIRTPGGAYTHDYAAHVEYTHILITQNRFPVPGEGWETISRRLLPRYEFPGPAFAAPCPFCPSFRRVAWSGSPLASLRCPHLTWIFRFDESGPIGFPRDNPAFPFYIFHV